MALNIGLGLGITRGWGPGRLFAAGAPGVWYDPSDWSTLFQDSAGTTPVTATGQPVGLMKDKSGRGNHASQATAANRPTFSQDGSGYYYLAFNGTNQGIATGNVDFSATAQMTVFSGLLKASDAATAIALELTASLSSFNGAFQILAPVGAATGNVRFGAKGTLAASGTQSAAVSEGLVFTGIADISAPRIATRKNGAYNGSDTATSMGTGNFSNAALNIGARSVNSTPSAFFNGRIYGLIVVGAAQSATAIARAERWMGQRIGIAL